MRACEIVLEPSIPDSDGVFSDQQEMITYFKETFENWCPVHVVRHRAAIKRSMNAGGSIFGENAEPTDMREVFLALAADLEGVAEVPADD